jgi:molybdenum cofactor biosynthesis enzyme MoaA
MGNVLLTNYCNRRCKYCFAQERIAFDDAGEGDESKRFLSFDDLETIIAFFKRSACSQVGLLGGEPTLHPHFPAIIDRFLAEGFRVKLFSNGMMPDTALEHL